MGKTDINGTRCALRVCALAASITLIGAVPATADAIYGCWTNGEEQLEVTREYVVTPGGAKPEAEIDRHGASYIAPEGERDAGRRLVFRQLNEEKIIRRVPEIASGPADVENWTPCRIGGVS